MSINTAHTSTGVLIHTGEYILLHCKNIDVEFLPPFDKIFYGMKSGYVYLTTHRMILRSKRQTELLRSLSAPFIAIDDISVPKESLSLLDSNSILGKVRAQPNGNFNGIIEFKLFFKSKNGAAVEFFNTLSRAISMTIQSDVNRYILPLYEPPRVWYEAPLEMHKCPPVFQKILPSNENYSFQSPSPNSVYMSDIYPPFPGIDMNNGILRYFHLLISSFLQFFQFHCEAKLMPSKNVKLSTPTESFDEFYPPPVKSGVVKCTYMAGDVFPHQSANSVCPSRNRTANPY